MAQPCFFLDQKCKKYSKELAHRNFYEHINKGIFKRVLKIRCLQIILKVLQPYPFKLCLQKVTVMQAEIKYISYRYYCKNNEEYRKRQ